MAEAELSIKYRSRAVTGLHLLSWLGLPISIVSTIWLFMCIQLSFNNLSARGEILGLSSAITHQNDVGSPVYSICLAFSMAAIAFALLLFVTSDTTIFITRNGLGVPFALLPGPWLRTKLKWSDLLNVDYLAQDDPKNGVLILTFAGKRRPRSLRLKTSRLSNEELEGLFLALDVWASETSNRSEHFKNLLEVRLKHQQITGGSRTEMWQDELARRFGSTNFIPLEPGDIVADGRFTVERQLAFGGLSAIYLVRERDGSRCILKEAVIPDSTDAETTQVSIGLLQKEATMLATLDNDRIAHIYDHFADRGRHYLQIEHIDGVDLRRYIKDHGPQSPEVVRAWAVEMAQLLVYLHDRDEPIIHRDFSPDNMILRKEDGTIALIDFGAANFFLGTATGTMIGKQAYIAPEQLRGKARPASDLYAFGGTLHFLLTGEDPEPLSPSRAVTRGESAEMDALVEAMTQMEAVDRPQSAAAVLEALQAMQLKDDGHIIHTRQKEGIEHAV